MIQSSNCKCRDFYLLLLVFSLASLGCEASGDQSKDCSNERSELVVEYFPSKPGGKSGSKSIENIHFFSATPKALKELVALSKNQNIEKSHVSLTVFSGKQMDEMMSISETLGSVASIRISLNIEETDHDYDRTLEQLSQLPKVTILSLVCPDPIHLTDRGMEAIGKMTRLERLTIPPFIKASSKSYQALSSLTELKQLELFDSNFNTDNLIYLVNLPLLKLWLHSCPVDDQAWRYFSQMSELEELALINTNISGNGARKLKSLPHLRELYLSGSPIDGNGLWELYLLKQIDSLGLVRCSEINSQMTELLSRFEHLSELDVSRTSLTSEDVSEIQAALKNTSVSFSGNNESVPK